jgi:hypothetical protein
MLGDFSSLKKELAELSTLLNEFKSEAVQLRILDFVLGRRVEQSPAGGAEEGSTRPRGKTRRNQERKPTAADGAGKRKKAPSGTGAPATLTQSLSGTFFDKPRTINDIIEHCKQNLARTFKANEFSGKLGRMVRNGELTRKKNAEKQYEYKKP